MDTLRTLSETKRTFYTLHTRPLNSIYRRVIEELLVEMHLLTVNVDFKYDSFYALGVTTVFDTFMQGYQPEKDKESIFNAICKAVESDPQQYRQDAEQVQSLADKASGEAVTAWLCEGKPLDQAGDLNDVLQGIRENPRFKYSRLFIIGIYTLLEKANPEIINDDKKREEVLNNCCQALNLPKEKVDKDLDLYRSNLEKMEQARSVLEDVVRADRKQRERRDQQQEQQNSDSGIELEKKEENTEV
ncbi:MAG: photosystem II biogenesis protein Psp29 [Halothece sp. Uz-M2-17]|nr:photosystem II biogenesis protein Psp29 [Halothece sp. Uz-M2-17]